MSVQLLLRSWRVLGLPLLGTSDVLHAASIDESMPNIKGAKLVKSFKFGLICVLATLGTSLLGNIVRADEGHFLYSKEEIKKIKKEMRVNPVDFQRVRENLQKISNIVSDENKDFIDSAQVEVEQFTLPSSTN